MDDSNEVTENTDLLADLLIRKRSIKFIAMAVNSISNSMSLNIRHFNKKTKDCDDSCHHYFVRYDYSHNSGVGYGLYCTEHKFIMNLPVAIAEGCIMDGAECIDNDLRKKATQTSS